MTVFGKSDEVTWSYTESNVGSNWKTNSWRMLQDLFSFLSSLPPAIKLPTLVDQILFNYLISIEYVKTEVVSERPCLSLLLSSCIENSRNSKKANRFWLELDGEVTSTGIWCDYSKARPQRFVYMLSLE